MDANLDDIAKLVTIARPIIEPLISTLIQPSINKLSKWLKKEDIESKVVDDFFENKFVDYLSLTLNRVNNINLLIFQNQQIKISDIYYPLTIFSSKDNRHYKIDSFDKSLFKNIKKILISDDAGMGKSTLSKWLIKTAMETKSAIPILIELRNLRDDHDVLDEIFYQFNPIDQDFDKDLILKFIQLGNFLIVFDGFDEIQIKAQEQIIKNLRNFINKAPDNWYLLTSRPEGSLSSFGDFQLFNIEQLKKNESYELIKKYDSIAQNKISDQLIKDIKEKYNQVSELLGNPFLVSLLYSTYTFNKDIPASKLSFYEEIYFALFKRHDLSKDGWARIKKSGLDILQFRTVLRQLAFDTAILGETNYSETELTALVTTAIYRCPGVDSSAELFVEDLLLTVPIFQREGLKIKWAHKSIQDFFAAEFIVYDSRKEVFLNTVYERNTENFNNILEFIIESDFKSFRKIIIKRLLSDYLQHYESVYTDEYFAKFKNIESRKAKTFGVHYFVKNARNRLDFDGIFENIDLEYPQLKPLQSRVLYYDGNNMETVSISGLQIAIIDMLVKRNQKYILISKQIREIKIRLGKNELYYVNDNPKSILNSKSNFDKITDYIPYVGNNLLYNEYAIIDYSNAKVELKKIEEDIALDISNFAFDSLSIKK